jgi:hypothetical protein
MQRGWTTAYHHLSERRQREMLLEAGLEERVLYPSSEWAEFVRSLRPATRPWLPISAFSEAASGSGNCRLR